MFLLTDENDFYIAVHSRVTKSKPLTINVKNNVKLPQMI